MFSGEEMNLDFLEGRNHMKGRPSCGNKRPKRETFFSEEMTRQTDLFKRRNNNRQT